ncbi:DNA/RNA non-specific endonuclease [Streptomyces sp. x-80]|uniref:DNA/RNA non-specific endonuclease n=1 Tax=Streptomyces sp. x-80 TaxID=2789282 RepID=UPI00397F20B9
MSGISAAPSTKTKKRDLTNMHEIRPRGAARRRARSTVLAVLAAVTLGLTTTGMAPVRQDADEKPRQIGKVDQTDRPDAPTPATETSSFPKESGERCEPTKAGSKERRVGAVNACVSVSPAPPRPSPARLASARLASVRPLAAGSCDITNPGSYSYERFRYCVTGVNVLYTLRDGNAKEIGRGTLEISTDASLSAKKKTWDEQVTVKMTGASGDVTALNAKFRASCTTGCTATKTAPWYGGALTVGQSVTGSVSYSSAPAAGAVAEFNTSYKLYVTSPGATAVDPNASWDNPRKIRCDDAVGGTSSAGCAVPSIMPVVPMSAQSSDPGGAVAAYQWAQKNLNDAWGKGKPLTRSTSDVADRKGRTCGGFDGLPELVDTDTCGEFPFAEAKEGGTDGAQCVEVIPNLGNREWDTYVLGESRDLDRTRPCVRAHVSAADQQFAEAKLTEGFADQRVIDADQFEVKFTTPDTGPHGRCLNTTPAGSLPNGDGWILNSAEPVPHVNKTITPIGLAGARPTQAQACLGRATVKGTAASGDITGWRDAQKFNTDNPPTSSQARCHLIANILGGKGQIRDGGQNNLVPCWQSGMNTGTPSMRTYETMAQNMIKGDVGLFGADDAIFYQVTPVYKDATSTIPVGVTMKANIERANGATEELFPNVYVPNTKGNTGLLNLGN